VRARALAALALLPVALAVSPAAAAAERNLERAFAGQPRDAPTATWSEDATRDYYNGALALPWKRTGGDWRDSTGAAQGSAPFARADLADSDAEQTIRIDVTALVRAHGADFVIRRAGGQNASIVSREGGAKGPKLIVTGRGETRTLAAVADTSIDPSTYRPLGDRPVLETRGTILIRFAQPPNPGIARAELVLTATGKQYGAQTLEVFRPDVGGGVAMPAFRAATAADTIVRWTGRDLTRAADWRHNAARARVEGDVLRAWLPRDGLTALSMILPVRGGEEAFATVVMRFDDDWAPPNGGKLPGFANTGQGKPAVGGLGPAGWGGRQANGLRWSARTGFDPIRDLPGRRSAWTGLHSYYYAMSPSNIWGQVEPWTAAAPRGRWFAYTQHVKLNTPGRADGVLGYWLDGTPVHRKTGIRWRDRGGPESGINEFWVDVYCGGTSCGPPVRDRTHGISLASITVTRTLPDMRAVAAEVDRLNGARR